MNALVFPDNTVLNNFALIHRMDLLARLVNGQGVWCATVATECDQGAQRAGLEDMTEAHQIFGKPWVPEAAEHIDIRILRDQMAAPGDSATQHLGEAETIVLASRRAPGSRFVTDDNAAARVAVLHGMTVVSTWQLLRIALNVKAVDPDALFGYLTTLRDANRGVPPLAVESRASFDVWCQSR